MSKSTEDTLSQRYEAGVRIKEELGKPRTYGKKLKVPADKREKLTEELGLSSDQFYKSLDFACLYKRKEFDALKKRRNIETGQSLSWTHVRALLSFSRREVAQREKLEEAAVDGGWSARRMWEEAKKIRGGPKKTSGGPRFKYDDLLRWSKETQRFLAGLFDEEETTGRANRLVIDRVLRESRQNRRELQELSELAAEISGMSQRLAERSGRQRRSKRS